MQVGAAEIIIGSVAHALQTEVDDEQPIISGELPIGGHRFEGPFRLNLHVDDVGHTLIFGPTGSGKPTLLALIAAQFRRYEAAQIFAFDKGKSLYPLTKAASGDHYEIGAGEGALAFCPLAELSTDGDRAWAAEWVETLVSIQGVTITPDHRNAIARQIALMAEARGRSLSDFVSGVQMREIKTALHHYTVDGPMGQLLDAEQDGLTLGMFQTFEVEKLMNIPGGRQGDTTPPARRAYAVSGGSSQPARSKMSRLCAQCHAFFIPHLAMSSASHPGHLPIARGIASIRWPSLMAKRIAMSPNRSADNINASIA